MPARSECAPKQRMSSLPTGPVIAAQGLTKRYGGVAASTTCPSRCGLQRSTLCSAATARERQRRSGCLSAYRAPIRASRCVSCERKRDRCRGDVRPGATAGCKPASTHARFWRAAGARVDSETSCFADDSASALACQSPGSATGAEDSGRAAEQGSFGSSRVHAAGADVGAGGVNDVGEQSEQPVRREFGVESSAALAADNERTDRLEGGPESPTQLIASQPPRVD
jgi:hypothetical protein